MLDQRTRSTPSINSLIGNIKIKTLKHIEEVRNSFKSVHYEKVKKKVTENFNYRNVMYALGEIEKF